MKHMLLTPKGVNRRKKNAFIAEYIKVFRLKNSVQLFKGGQKQETSAGKDEEQPQQPESPSNSEGAGCRAHMG